MTIKAVLPYPGATWRLAAWILHHLPPHRMYLEPYLGSGAVFFKKNPSTYELLNDRDGDVVNLFQVMRDWSLELAARIELTPWARQEYLAREPAFNEPDGTRSDDPGENARQFLVRGFHAHGVRTDQLSGWHHVGPHGHAMTVSLWRQRPLRLRVAIDRLKDAEIACQDAITLIEAYHQPHLLIYADPPYVRSTRHSTYDKHEMTLDQHAHLLDVLDAHRGPVVLSGYAHPLSDERLAHGLRVTAPAVAEYGRMRTEVLWLNRHARHAQLAMWSQTAKEKTNGNETLLTDALF